MDQETIKEIKNERQNLESTMNVVRENLKIIDDGGSITKTLFNADLGSLKEATDNFKSKLCIQKTK